MHEGSHAHKQSQWVVVRKWRRCSTCPQALPSLTLLSLGGEEMDAGARKSTQVRLQSWAAAGGAHKVCLTIIERARGCRACGLQPPPAQAPAAHSRGGFPSRCYGGLRERRGSGRTQPTFFLPALRSAFSSALRAAASAALWATSALLRACG